MTAEPSVSVGLNCFAHSSVNLSPWLSTNWLRITEQGMWQPPWYYSEEKLLHILCGFNLGHIAYVCVTTCSTINSGWFDQNICRQFPEQMLFSATATLLYVSHLPVTFLGLTFMPVCLHLPLGFLDLLESIEQGWKYCKRTNQLCLRISSTFNFLLDVNGSASSISHLLPSIWTASILLQNVKATVCIEIR